MKPKLFHLKFKLNELRLNLDNKVNQFQQGYVGKSVSTSTNHVGNSNKISRNVKSISTREIQSQQTEMQMEG